MNEDGSPSATIYVRLGKPLALIAYLAMTPRRTATRARLCDLLWGDRPDPEARTQLRQTIWQIRTALGADSLATVGDLVSLAVSVEVDAEKFVEALSAGRILNALELYEGDFFASYAAPGAREFEDWAEGERTRFRSMFVQAADASARDALDKGRIAEAASIGKRLREQDPFGQTGWRILIESRVLANDRIGALAEAAHFNVWLEKQEISAEPSTLAILASLRNIDPEKAADRSHEISSELVGREREFGQLQEAWRRASHTTGVRLHISAPPGLGKTRLLADFATRLRLARAVVIDVRANPGERRLAFSFVAAIAAKLAELPGACGVSPQTAATLVTLNPTLSNLFPHASAHAVPLDARRCGLALLELASSASEEDPFALLLDDLHWSDPESTSALSLVFARCGDQRILVVTSARPNHYDTHESVTANSIILEPLQRDAIRQMAGSIAQIPNEGWANRFIDGVADSTKGNPLLALQLIRHLVDTATVTIHNDTWKCSDEATLESALSQTNVVASRLSQLGSHQKKVIEAAAVAGVPLPIGALAGIAGLPAKETEDLLVQLEVEGFIARQDRAFVLAHDSIQESILDSLSSPEKALLSREIGSRLSSGQDVSLLRVALTQLVSGNDWEGATALTERLLRLSRNYSGSVAERVDLLLGGTVGTTVSQNIVRRLPLRIRRPALLRAAFAMTALFALSAVTLLAVSSREEIQSDDPELLLFRKTEANGVPVSAVQLSAKDWDATKPLKVNNESLVGRLRSWSHRPRQFAARPGTRSWATYRTYNDSGGGEIDLDDVNAGTRRLTFRKGEDIVGSFSPDGKKLVFLSSQWSKKGWGSLAIFDMQSGAISRISGDSDRIINPLWSPDGTRIAFTRATQPTTCVVNVDGSGLHCVPGTIGSATGWWNSRQLLIGMADDEFGRTAKIVDVATGSIQSLEVEASDLSIDPSGRWVLLRQGKNQKEFLWMIAPVGRPKEIRTVTFAGDPPFDVRFATPHLADNFINAIEIQSPVSTPLMRGVPYQFRVIGRSLKGRELPVESVQWTASPGGEVTSEGLFVARDTGVVSITASAGGWRTASVSVRVAGQASTTLVVETWDSGWRNRWIPFGEPGPVVSERKGTKAFATNGDDDYLSGAYSRFSIAAEKGIAVDFDLSTPITATQWQEIIVSVGAVSDSSGLAKWNSRRGYISQFFDDGACSFYFPGGEGQRAWARQDWFPGLQLTDPRLAEKIASGARYTVRLQLFPDGRCGLAINRHALSAINLVLRNDNPRKLLIEGKNVGSKLLLYPLRVRSGVPDDVDWSRLSYNGSRWVRIRP